MSILAVDCGTTNCKATLVARDGTTMASSSCAYRNTTFTAPGGIAEQQPEDWWFALKACVQELLYSNRAHMSSIAAISLSGQMQDVIFVGSDGTAFGAAILYSDSRAQEEAGMVEARFGRDRLCRGNWKGPLSILPKLLWCHKHRTADLACSEHILLGAHSYLTMKLCGRAVCDRVTASTTGLLRADGSGYCNEMIDALLPEATGKLPPLVAGSDSVGALSAAAAEWLGLEDAECGQLQVFHGCGDAGATTLGVNAGVEDQPYMYCGTSGWVAATMRRESELKPGVFALAHPTDERFVIAAASCMQAGAAIEWLRNIFHHPLPAEQAYARIDELAQGSRAGAGGVIFAPWLLGERAPFSDPNARACFIGISSSTTDADLHRAVLEGVCYSFRALRDTVLPPPPPHAGGGGTRAVLRAVGGGSKSAFWMQLFADILHQDICVMRDGQNAGARGAALLAGLGLGWYTNLAPTDFYPTGETYRARRARPPSTARSAQEQHESAEYSVYDDVYSVYRGLHIPLQQAFAELARIARKPVVQP